MAEIRIKLDHKSIQKIAYFEKITRAKVKDCIEKEDEMIFIISSDDFGKAIGKGGRNVKLLGKKFKKRITLIEFDQDPKEFAKNLLKPVRVKSMNFEEDEDGNKMLNIVINTSQRAFPSKKVKNTKKLLTKYFPNLEKVYVRV